MGLLQRSHAIEGERSERAFHHSGDCPQVLVIGCTGVVRHLSGPVSPWGTTLLVASGASQTRGADASSGWDDGGWRAADERDRQPPAILGRPGGTGRGAPNRSSLVHSRAT